MVQSKLGDEQWPPDDGIWTIEDPNIPIHHDGPRLDFTLTSFGVPVVTDRLSHVIAASAGGEAQLIPCRVGGEPGFVIPHTLNRVKCVDEDRSVFEKWTTESFRPDLAGQYCRVDKLVVRGDLIPSGANFFRIWGWEVLLIVSETMKQAMEAAGCHGAVFVPVELS
jgi:hypothetical protein